MSTKRDIRIVTIGGGNGTSIINKSLLNAGVSFIDSIVTVMDSGGITGRMRIDSEGKLIAYSDALRNLLSLIDEKSSSPQRISTLIAVLRNRNARQEDLGYEFFSHFFDQENNGFSEVQSKLTNLTGIKFKGKVIPITLKSTNIVFTTQLGREYKGEHELDDKRMSTDQVKDMYLNPQVPAYGLAIAAVKNADFIFFSCGSLYGSVLCNFLPLGMKEALAKSQAKKILVTNLVSTRNETHNFKPLDFIRIFKKYTGLKKPIDVMVVPKMTRQQFETKFPETSMRYRTEHSFFLGWNKSDLRKIKSEKINVVTHNATYIEPVHLTLRHNPDKLSRTFKKLIADLNPSRIKENIR